MTWSFPSLDGIQNPTSDLGDTCFRGAVGVLARFHYASNLWPRHRNFRMRNIWR
jgi:hypothetical protein